MAGRPGLGLERKCRRCARVAECAGRSVRERAWCVNGKSTGKPAKRHGIARKAAAGKPIPAWRMGMIIAAERRADRDERLRIAALRARTPDRSAPVAFGALFPEIPSNTQGGEAHSS